MTYMKLLMLAALVIAFGVAPTGARQELCSDRHCLEGVHGTADPREGTDVRATLG